MANNMQACYSGKLRSSGFANGVLNSCYILYYNISLKYDNNPVVTTASKNKQAVSRRRYLA